MITIRKIQSADERRWRELWDGYTHFYEREPVAEITDHLWSRIHDAACPVFAIVAEQHDQVIAIAHYLVHESTSQLRPVCYLQDLFVDPERRRLGIGRMMIDWLIAEMKAQHWSRLYWQTKENNHQARALYDTYTPHSGFVRYVIENRDEETIS